MMVKQMASTSIGDLITFLKLFPNAELICDADTGVLSVELEEVQIPSKGPF